MSSRQEVNYIRLLDIYPSTPTPKGYGRFIHKFMTGGDLYLLANGFHNISWEEKGRNRDEWLGLCISTGKFLVDVILTERKRKTPAEMRMFFDEDVNDVNWVIIGVAYAARLCAVIDEKNNRRKTDTNAINLLTYFIEGKIDKVKAPAEDKLKVLLWRGSKD